MSAQFKSELLEELQAKVTHDAYILYEALANCLTDTVSYEALPDAIEQVADYVHSVGEYAGKANLLGLQRVCDLTQQYMSTLVEPQESLCGEVERWPRLVSNYLYAPDNLIHCQQLISALQHTDWQEPLSNEQAQELVVLLKQEAVESAAFSSDMTKISPFDIVPTLPAIDDAVVENEQEPVELSDDLAETAVDLLGEDSLFEVLAESKQLPEIIEEELSSDSESIESDLPTIAEFEDEFFAETIIEEDDELYESFDETIAFNTLATGNTPIPLDESEECVDDLEATELIEEIDEDPSLDSFDNDVFATLAEDNVHIDEEADFDSVEDIPLLAEVTTEYSENSDELPVAIAPFADVSEQEFDKILDETVFDATEELDEHDSLPETTLPTIELEDEFFEDENEELDEIVDDLENISLEESVLALQASVNDYPSEQIEEIAEKVEKSAIVETSTDTVEERYSEDLENLSNNVVELSDILSTALNKFITEESDTEPFLEGIEEYTNAVQSLWEAAEKCGFTGLQQICTFISDNIFELSTQSQAERFVLHDLFALYPQLILEYLHHASSGSTKLVELLQNPQWATPLISVQADELLKTLRQEAEIALQEANYINQPELEPKQYAPNFTHHEEIGEEAEKEIEVIDSSDDNTVEEMPSTDENIVQDNQETYDFTDDMMAAFGEVFGQQESEEVIEITPDSIDDETILDEEWIDETTIDSSDLDDLDAEIVPDNDEWMDEPIPEFNEHEASEAIIDSDSEIALAAMTLNNDENIPNNIQLVEPEIIDWLDAEISDAINDLSKALARFTTAADNSPELLEAVEQYADNVSSIASEAETTGLIGLKEVCEFVNENLLELSAHAHAIRRNAYAHIEKWPHLVLYYLHTPLQGARELVAHLSAPAWFLPLSQERADVLLHTLTNGALGNEQSAESIEEDLLNQALDLPEIDDIESEEDSTEFVESIDESEEIVSTPTIELAAPEVLELLIAQITETKEELSNIFTELVTADDNIETVLVAIENYTENVQTIWDTAEMANLVGLQQVCAFVNDNVMVLGRENQQVRNTARDVFETWIHFVLAYLNNPYLGAGELVTHLQAVHWPQPLSSEQAETLKQQLLITHVKEEVVEETVTTVPVATHDVEPEIVLAPAESLDLLIGQLTDISEELTNDLQILVAAEDGSEELLTAVETYTENVQAIWDAAEMVGLLGVQEVCTFVNDNIMLLSASDKATRTAAHSVFATWHLSVLTYLQTPRLGANALVTQLQNPLWAAPLDNQQAEQLIQHLLTTEKTENNAVEPIIVLADPDVLALIIGQITDIADELSTTLMQLIQAEDGSESLLTAVEAYTENVQAIWDAAEMANLVGLQDVCTFINDNVMLLSAGDQATRQTAHEVFDGWTQFVLAYLNNPATGAIELIKHLQQAQWFAPLNTELATTLQQRLLNSSASAKTEEPQVYLADPDVLEVVRSQITDVIDGLSETLKVCVSMENDNPALLEAIENYTNSVQAIWDTAEMAGLGGLQEVCTFVNDNLMALGTQEPPAKLAAQDCFIQWPNTVLAYLQSPLTGATDLIHLLQNANWPTPLADEQAETLLPLLTQSSQEPTQVAAYEAQIAEETVPTSTEEDSEPVEPLPELDSDRQEISLGSAEVLEILTSELESAKEELTVELEKFTTLNNQEAGFSEAAENYGDIVMRLYAAAEMLGLEGLQAITNLIVDNVKALAESDLATRVKAKKVLEMWPDLVLAYLTAPMAGVIPMLNHFRESGWVTPLADEKAHELLSLLTQAPSAEDEEEESSAYARQTVASPEDVVLTLPDDLNPDLFEAYLQETPQHASDFSQLIQGIIADPKIQEIERAQRIAHTLKGSSNIIGIKGIASMGHHLEDILEYLAKNQVKPPKELTDVMVEAADCIEMMVDSLTGQGDPPDNAQQILQKILDWANRIDKGNLDAPPVSSAAAAPSSSSETTATAEAKPKKEGSAVAAGAPEQVLRVPTKTVDDLMRLVGELSISLGQIQERLKHVIANSRTLNEQNLILQKKTFELENLVDIRGVTGIEKRDSNRMMENDDEEVIEFDALEFEEYNELHSVAHSFIESIADNRELGSSLRMDLLELEGMVIQQERLSKEFQATIMTTRMVPVSTMVSKLQRNVRQTCRSTGKQAELVVEGTDILMDSDVLNNLADPLQHIIRNSVDHGLEMPDERVLLGKVESGTIVLRFYREGNNIVVSCQDDGQGLNYTNIRYTAIQRGLITEGQEVTEPELARLILMSGFSTKSGVTQMSGRGVGMDVVHTNIRQMKGTLDILSETGKGTNMVIKLPMTLVTMHVLIVRVGTFRYGIPTNTLEQVLAHGTGELQRIGNEISFKMGKHVYPVKMLSSLLNVTGDSNEVKLDDQRPLLLVREETGIITVVVDELIDTHDLVMKSMGQYVKKVRGVSGASILGDGTLVPLLDLPELLRSPTQSIMSSYEGEEDEEGSGANVAARKVPRVLIIDDSLSVRKSLSLLVEEAGFEILLAKDGLEGIEVMNQTRPNVILVDMEMPRMNGLEFTSHVRANKATEKLPIFMITSRTTEKHREQAKTAGVSAYVTKPYQDNELLDLIDKGLAGKF